MTGKKQTSATALLVVGNEEYLRARAITAFTTALADTAGDLSPRTVDADGLTTGDVLDLLSPELFGGLPVLTITTGNRLTPAALAVVADSIPSPGSAVIVEIPKSTDAGAKAVITALTKAGATVETVTPPKNAKDKRAFAQDELRTAGLRADSDTIAALADGEADLRGIATRTRQLADDHTTGTSQPTITVEHIRTVATTAPVTGFPVADALAARNPRALTTALREALDAGAAPLFIQAACLATLRDIASIQSGRTGKMPPWKAQKLTQTARRWTPADLARALDEMGVIGESVRSTVRTHTDLTAALLRAIG